MTLRRRRRRPGPAALRPDIAEHRDRHRRSPPPPSSSPLAKGLAEAALHRTRDAVEPVLRAAIDTLPGRLRTIAAYHFGWEDAEGARSTASAASCCGRVWFWPPRRRRGREGRRLPGTGRRGGRGAGAQLHAAARRRHRPRPDPAPPPDRVDGVRRRERDPGRGRHAGARAAAGRGRGGSRLAECVIEICDGQYEDCAFEQRDDVTLEECLAMAGKKTGALLGCACALGGLAVRADPLTVAALDLFGRELGMAFQLTDDLLGIWGDPAVTGKPVGRISVHGRSRCRWSPRCRHARPRRGNWRGCMRWGVTSPSTRCGGRPTPWNVPGAGRGPRRRRRPHRQGARASAARAEYRTDSGARPARDRRADHSAEQRRALIERRPRHDRAPRHHSTTAPRAQRAPQAPQHHDTRGERHDRQGLRHHRRRPHPDLHHPAPVRALHPAPPARAAQRCRRLHLRHGLRGVRGVHRLAPPAHGPTSKVLVAVPS